MSTRNWRRTREYRHWRVAVIRRDKACQCCGSRQHRHAHHLNHATYFPDQRFTVANGITLCAQCHRRFHCDFTRSYRHKCERADWQNFLVLKKYLQSLR